MEVELFVREGNDTHGEIIAGEREGSTRNVSDNRHTQNGEGGKVPRESTEGKAGMVYSSTASPRQGKAENVSPAYKSDLVGSQDRRFHRTHDCVTDALDLQAHSHSLLYPNGRRIPNSPSPRVTLSSYNGKRCSDQVRTSLKLPTARCGHLQTFFPLSGHYLPQTHRT